MIEIADILRFSAIVIALAFTFTFAIALFCEDNSIIDIVYGATFVLVAWCLAFLWPFWSDRQLILIILVTLWGMRLTTRIFLKNWKKPEDFRYRTWREAWKQRGMLYFFFRSLFQIYFLQGVVVLVILLPIVVGFSQKQLPLEWYNWLGLGVWLVGFFFESIGDWQLDRFLAKEENQGKIMTGGLWRFTRHPNYFGEAIMWWGIFLVVWGLPAAGLTILSPLLITYLLTQVSGIPMLEARWAGQPDWEEYKKKTSAFVPWFPRKGM